MGQIVKRVEDKRLLKLIRAFLNVGVMENGVGQPERGRDSARWSRAKALSVGLSNTYFKSLGLPTLIDEVKA
jgi:hypothetical protein